MCVCVDIVGCSGMAEVAPVSGTCNRQSPPIPQRTECLYLKRSASWMKAQRWVLRMKLTKRRGYPRMSHYRAMAYDNLVSYYSSLQKVNMGNHQLITV